MANESCTRTAENLVAPIRTVDRQVAASADRCAIGSAATAQTTPDAVGIGRAAPRRASMMCAKKPVDCGLSPRHVTHVILGAAHTCTMGHRNFIVNIEKRSISRVLVTARTRVPLLGLSD